jgi:hypothetical protein
MQAYSNTIENLISAQTETPIITKLSSEAQEERSEVMRAVEALKILPDTSAAFRAHLNKWEALFARLALTFHAVETIGMTGGGITNEVSGDTASRVACLMLDFMLPNAARFYSDTFGSEGQIEDARWIAGYILAHKVEKISARDIGRAYRSLRGNISGIQSAMEVLHTASWVEPAETYKFGRIKKWLVNPAVHARFAELAVSEKTRREMERTRIKEATKTLGLADAVEEVA